MTASEIDDRFNGTGLRPIWLGGEVDGEWIRIGRAFRLMHDGDDRLVQGLLIQRGKNRTVNLNLREHLMQELCLVILGEQKFVHTEAIAGLSGVQCKMGIDTIRSFTCHNWAYAIGALRKVIQQMNRTSTRKLRGHVMNERSGWGKPDDLVLKGGRRWLEEKNLKTSG